MSDIDTAAEAICKAHQPYLGSSPHPALYRFLARAAIDALQLTQEQKHMEDGYSGITYHRDGTSTAVSRPATRLSRWVTPWAVDEEPA